MIFMELVRGNQTARPIGHDGEAELVVAVRAAVAAGAEGEPKNADATAKHEAEGPVQGEEHAAAIGAAVAPAAVGGDSQTDRQTDRRAPSARRPSRDGRRGGASAPSVLEDQEFLGRLQPALERPARSPNVAVRIPVEGKTCPRSGVRAHSIKPKSCRFAVFTNPIS